jgi:hypothetical protein
LKKKIGHASMTETSNTTPTEAATEAFEKVVVTVTDSSKEDAEKSALQDNIDRMGKNAYYFAHAHKADGPKWDGKVEPKLLSSRSISSEEATFKKTSVSFDMHKSNITSYAFSDEGKNVKLYLTMEDVGEKCLDEDISLEWTDTSFCLVVNNYKEEPQCLSFGKLTATIIKATCRKKKDRLVLTLTKEKEGEWHTINDKGTHAINDKETGDL